MRRILKLSVLCIAAGVVNACKPDEVVTTTAIPTAGVRFINAVPDTMPLDFRFVDLVESNAHFRIAFRNNPVTTGTGLAGITASTQIQFKGAREGAARHFRIFLNDTLQANASQIIKDSTLNLVAGHNYSVLLMGYARASAPVADKMRLQVVDETVADPGAGKTAVRVINATNAAIDVTAYKDATAPGAAQWVNQGPFSISTYVVLDTSKMRYRVTPNAVANTLFADALALAGVPATVDIEALAGTQISGSAVTGIVFPGSVVGSLAPQFVTSTGSSRLDATATGYRGPRSFISDGFVVGMQVNATGFNATNNGVSTVTGMVDGSTTGNLTTLRATAGGNYVRGAGSFATNGFAVGDVVTVSGFTTAANNGESTVTAVTPLILTTTKATVVEAGTTGSTSLAANAVGYSRPAGDFVVDGFVIGHTITASGFTNALNNGTSVITNVTATDLTVSKTGGTVTEAAAVGRTIAVGTNRTIVAFGTLTVTKAGGTVAQAAAGSRTIVTSPPPAGISFMWDRRPPRTCAPLC